MSADRPGRSAADDCRPRIARARRRPARRGRSSMVRHRRGGSGCSSPPPTRLPFHSPPGRRRGEGGGRGTGWRDIDGRRQRLGGIARRRRHNRASAAAPRALRIAWRGGASGCPAAGGVGPRRGPRPGESPPGQPSRGRSARGGAGGAPGVAGAPGAADRSSRPAPVSGRVRAPPAIVLRRRARDSRRAAIDRSGRHGRGVTLPSLPSRARQSRRWRDPGAGAIARPARLAAPVAETQFDIAEIEKCARPIGRVHLSAPRDRRLHRAAAVRQPRARHPRSAYPRPARRRPGDQPRVTAIDRSQRAAGKTVRIGLVADEERITCRPARMRRSGNGRRPARPAPCRRRSVPKPSNRSRQSGRHSRAARRRPCRAASRRRRYSDSATTSP